MAGRYTARSLVRLLLILAAWAVTLSWLAVLFVFPDSWRDHHGYNQLSALILTSGLHWAVCFPLTVACMAGVIRSWLPKLAYLAPLAHVAGSSIDGLWCLPFFVIPSMAILVAGFLEVRDPLTE